MVWNNSSKEGLIFSTSFNIISNFNYFIQFFMEEENGFSEENSIKYSVKQNNEIQKFEFDLKNFLLQNVTRKKLNMRIIMII